VQREYDLFELLNGALKWRGSAVGLPEARAKLYELSHKTSNECFAMYLPTEEIVARVNVRAPDARRPAVFQISYDPTRAISRTKLLRLHGCDVTFVIGNEAAKAILSTPQHWDLFMVGSSAPQETVTEMIAWLKSRYPDVPILSLSSTKTAQSPDGGSEAAARDLEECVPGISAALAVDGSRS
jgi:hypothetical protein